MISEKTYRWENNDQYYEAHIGRDIFGDLVVTCYYGSKHRKTAKRVTYPVKSIEEAYQLIEDISQKRITKGKLKPLS
ncbi:hypothetical protein L3V83_01995 [Thiotrichales bacterium 19X7-9]|nr:hypothetical protein [Thiotrichales bacterium 19X7-9]TNF67212.1 MAG: hypothetical protein EP298_07105 [Gammaproteobacteria bacterium]UTW42720.1 hypothetical protein KFE69_00815 [bacterium SCSIO 12844]